MKYPKNELAQLIIASVVQHQITDVVISPGSRNAPLTIGFSAINFINTYSVVDERAAAFVALGMAQQSKKPVAVVCTSGSALLNYYPAVAEAFYSNIPLVVISADRPAEKIDIGDGQTIRQKNVLENHVVYQVALNEIKNKVDRAYNLQQIAIALQKATTLKGPVHINVPFEEPLYELVDNMLCLPALENKESHELIEQPLEVSELSEFANLWNTSAKKMVILGVHEPDELLQVQIDHLLKDPSVIVLSEATSNIHHPKVIQNIDQFLSGINSENEQDYQPDILISIGGLVISKRIKQYLRKFQPKEHWVVHPFFGYDTYGCLTQYFKISATLFFSQFFWLTKNHSTANYQSLFLTIKEKVKLKHNQLLTSLPYTDLTVMDAVLKWIPKKSTLQLSNSAVVRYAQLFDINPSVEVFCNRGTSGIDGSTSTAVGYAMSSKTPTTLVTGDISFLYDSNGLWNSYIPTTFRIIIINNNGGGIFKILPGPAQTEALDYFVTPHGLNASYLAAMYGFEYAYVDRENVLGESLEAFFKESHQPKILEIFTPSDVNDKVLKEYFQQLK